MRFTRYTLMAAALVAAAALPARAQDDAEGSKDHPMFSRMPGYLIANYNAADFGPADFDIGKEEPKHVEGKFWKIDYAIKEGARKAGPLQIGRNYTELMLKRGGKKLVEHFDSGGGATTATMPIAGGRSLWLMVEVSNDGDLYQLTIVEEGSLKQEVEFTPGAVAEELKTAGTIVLHNIQFDTGKATLKPESAGALSVIGDVLKSDGSLKLEIQGHTDNVGSAAANLKLSQDRAAAVKAHLVQKFGIAADRLTTAGFGDTKPIADNKTDEGRAQNRRVELVKK